MTKEADPVHLKGSFTPFCHLLSPMSFQTCMTSYLLWKKINLFYTMLTKIVLTTINLQNI